MPLSRCLLLVLFLAALGCSAQQSPAPADAQLQVKIERQIRERFRIPSRISCELSPIQPSQFSGYDSIDATFSDGDDRQVLNFLISKDRKTLVRLTTIDITKDPYEEVMQKIDLRGRAIRGNKDAKVTIINYDDFQCPYCSQMHSNLQAAVRQFPTSVRVVYKDFPLPFHRWATRAAIDANCLAQLSGDAFWDYADTVHGQADQLANSGSGLQESFGTLDKIALDSGSKHKVDTASLQRCIQQQPDTQVKKSIAEGDSLGVDGTPTVFVNGERLPGLVTEEQLVAVIKQHLQQQSGQTAPVK